MQKVEDGEWQQVSAYHGPPLHPVLAERTVERHGTVMQELTIFLHQLAFGPDPGVLPTRLSSHRFYTIHMTPLEYETLPVCQWRISDDDLVSVRELGLWSGNAAQSK